LAQQSTKAGGLGSGMSIDFRRPTLWASRRPSLSKPIIDEIDRTLAAHYGFTPEELDFIVDYDIKYRLGREADDRDDE